MKEYLNFTQTRANYSFQHSFNLIYRKIEAVLFSFLCVVFLISSKLESNFSRNVSFGFINISLPIVKVISFPFNSTINLLTSFNELIEAKQENALLKEENEKLKSFYISSLNIHQENIELKNILSFVSVKSSGFKVAKIVGRSNQAFNQKIFLDAGKDRGISEGSIVTGDRAAIGRVIETGDNKSVVMLITDSSSRIPVISSKTSVRAILAGNGSNLMELLYLPKNHDIVEGDWIFTSGDGDTLPPAVLIGVVVKSKDDYVAVAMAEDINKANFVAVMNY
jgi:rod shape-determining protein MreC